MFADLAFEASIGFDDEFDTGVADACGEGFPVRLGEDDAEVRDRDIVAVDCVAVRVGEVGGAGFEVGDDLVAEEVEVDPMPGAAALGAAEDGAVEVAGGCEVVDGEGDVEGTKRRHGQNRVLGRHAVENGCCSSYIVKRLTG